MKNHFIPGHLLFLLFAILLTTCTFETEKSNPDKEAWIPLFNGVDMKDWTPKFVGQNAGVNYKNTFDVADSLLRVRYTEADTFHGQFGHLFYKEKFSHYRLKATYRFVGTQLKGGPGWAIRNNGLMLHCQSPRSMAIDQEFPNSLELQLLGGNGEDERPTANLCTPGTHVMMADTLFTTHCITSTSKTYHGDQWVEVEVLVLGDSLIHHKMEGKTVMNYHHPTIDAPESDDHGKPVGEGYISIQAETHPIDFKSIELLNLCGCMDKKAKNYKSYFVKADDPKCIY